MEKLTELKDNQKILVAFTVKKRIDNTGYDLFDSCGDDYMFLSNDLKSSSKDEYSQEIYDFDQVINQVKNEIGNICDFTIDENDSIMKGEIVGYILVDERNKNFISNNVFNVKKKADISEKEKQLFELAKELNYELKKNN